MKLRKAGTTTSISATVSYDAATRKAILNPRTNLTRGASYVATVTAGTKSLAGTALDQDPTASGNQARIWKFKVKK